MIKIEECLHNFQVLLLINKSEVYELLKIGNVSTLNIFGINNIFS